MLTGIVHRLPLALVTLASHRLHQPTLVFARSLLTGLQLVQIPSAYGQIALVLVHALTEAGYFNAAYGGSLVAAGLDLLRGLLLLGRC